MPGEPADQAARPMVMDSEDSQALIDVGLDPDNPSVVAALALVRWELQHFLGSMSGSRDIDELVPVPQHRSSFCSDQVQTPGSGAPVPVFISSRYANSVVSTVTFGR